MENKNIYKNLFQEAYKRTQQFELKPPLVKYSADIFLTKEFIEEMPYQLIQKYGLIDINEITANCMGFHYMIKPFFEYLLSSDVYFTLGFITIEEDTLFYIDDNIIKELLEEGVKSKLNIHAWLTLPTMEILDFTLLTTYAQVKNIQEGMGGVIVNKADNLIGGMAYHPILIGDQFLREIGGLIEF